MDFGYTSEQQALRQQVQEFIAEHVTDGVMGEIESGEEGGRGQHYRELIKKVAERNQWRAVMFRSADFGIVGTWEEYLPPLIEALRPTLAELTRG